MLSIENSITNLQTNIQAQLLGKIISTNNENTFANIIMNTFIQVLIISFIGTFITKLTFIGNSLSLFPYKILSYMKVFISLFLKKQKSVIKKAEISYITENKQINELYKPVYQYITNNKCIDYSQENYMKYNMFDLDLYNQEKNIINKVVPENNTIIVEYKNKNIECQMSTEVLTIYGEKDRKKENYKIILTTSLLEKDKSDILDNFINHCVDNYIKNMTNTIWKQEIYTNIDNQWTKSVSNNYRKLDTIILKNNLKKDIQSDIELFLNSEEWYKDRDIPYTRGYLFYGHPGTGKSTMIKGVSLFCKRHIHYRHIHYLSLSNINSDEQLLSLMKDINYSETILVIEDIDATINAVLKRKNNEKEKNSKKKKDKQENTEITLAGLLNCIDGLFNVHGRILIMTSNHPEVLDEALIRPGRIDGKYFFDNCDVNQITNLYKMFFGDSPNQKDLENLKSSNYSPAHITSVFLRYRNNPSLALKNLDNHMTIISS
jgi:ATP-dependent 26S proteasome regulatory subunit